MAAIHTNRLMNHEERRASVHAEEARLRDEFLSLASHELLTPLTSLTLQAQLIRRAIADQQVATPERVAAMLEVFDRQLGRLGVLCDELVQASCIQAGQLSVTRERVDLGALVRGAAARAAAQQPSLAGAIVVETDEGLWGCVDRAQVERLVLHLVKNAATFGKGQPIVVSARATASGARIAVRDRGIGIAKEDQARIFERFERAVPVRHFGGLGLGLYIARAVAQAHGGSIRVESEPGEGSVFTVELPLREESEELPLSARVEVLPVAA
ncbi:sensor histidine kinase [Chondromyces apiculatus]|uniref:histidine kinase n=1 Tax=Chondromyces apiculatus DSM 436 TaxID=1192034 RepID=A0A017T5Y4_9BACT|nr:HAMP domain-containing sensor histidine kinase [Chondromyces apiculatus]EYF04668.1 Response regulator/sensor histidine kinase [Chondromyces apiculatus DSM 436]